MQGFANVYEGIRFSRNLQSEFQSEFAKGNQKVKGFDQATRYLQLHNVLLNLLP